MKTIYQPWLPLVRAQVPPPRSERARWWFEQMHKAVNQNTDNDKVSPRDQQSTDHGQQNEKPAGRGGARV